MWSLESCIKVGRWIAAAATLAVGCAQGSTADFGDDDDGAAGSGAAPCAAGCSVAMPGNGSCESACNVPACNFDDGDWTTGDTIFYTPGVGIDYRDAPAGDGMASQMVPLRSLLMLSGRPGRLSAIISFCPTFSPLIHTLRIR